MAETNALVTGAVAKLNDDKALRDEFMTAFRTSEAAAVKFMVEKLGLPTDLSEKVAKLQGDDMAGFVGRNVCSYIW